MERDGPWERGALKELDFKDEGTATFTTFERLRPRDGFVRRIFGKWLGGSSTNSTPRPDSTHYVFHQEISWSFWWEIVLANTAFALTSSTEFVLFGLILERLTSRLLIIIEVAMLRIPTHGPPTHPGEMLLEEFLKPLGLTQREMAKRLGISYPRLNEIIRGRRGMTADTAMRLEQLLGMEAQFWMNLQLTWDLYHAKRSAAAKAIRKIHRLPALRRAS